MVLLTGCAVQSETSGGDAVAGRVAYEQSCAACHGIAGRGTDRGPTFLDPVYEPSHHADGAFLLAVRRGVREHHWNFGDMPPIANVSDEEVADIVAYVRGLQAEVGIE